MVFAPASSQAQELYGHEGIDAETAQDMGNELWLAASALDINLNSCSREELEMLYFLTSFEKSALWHYLEHNRPLHSIYELAYVLGLSAEKARILERSCHVSGKQEANARPRSLKQQAQVYTGSRVTYNGGSPDRHWAEPQGTRRYARYRVQGGFAEAGFTAESDPGETMALADRSYLGADYFSAYAKIENSGNYAIIGDYNLRLGQGLSAWQGFSPGRPFTPSSARRSPMLARPHRSAEENNFCRGAAAYASKGKLAVLGFASSKDRDGYFASGDVKLQNTGIHVTDLERERRKNVRHSLAGASLAYKQPYFNAAAQYIRHGFSAGANSGRQGPADSLGYGVASMDAAARKGNVLAFGEIAASQNMNIAFIAGLELQASSNIDITWAARNYPQGFVSHIGQAMGEYSGLANEQGLYSGFQYSVSSLLSLSGYADYFRSPQPRHIQSYSSTGMAAGLSASGQISEGLSYMARWAKKEKEQDISGNDDVMRRMEKRSRQSYSARLIGQIGPLAAQAAYLGAAYRASAGCEYGNMMLASTEVKIRERAAALLQLATFSTSYSSRIYAYEPHIPGSISVPAHIGTGTKIAGRLAWKFPQAGLYAKAAYWNYITSYKDKPEEIGKLHLYIAANVKW
jgi:hypothetical protein